MGFCINWSMCACIEYIRVDDMMRKNGPHVLPSVSGTVMSSTKSFKPFATRSNNLSKRYVYLFILAPHNQHITLNADTHNLIFIPIPSSSFTLALATIRLSYLRRLRAKLASVFVSRLQRHCCNPTPTQVLPSDANKYCLCAVPCLSRGSFISLKSLARTLGASHAGAFALPPHPRPAISRPLFCRSLRPARTAPEGYSSDGRARDRESCVRIANEYIFCVFISTLTMLYACTCTYGICYMYIILSYRPCDAQTIDWFVIYSLR